MDTKHVIASLQTTLNAINMAKITVARAMVNTTTDKALLELHVVNLTLNPMAIEALACLELVETMEKNDKIAYLNKCLEA